MVTKIKFYLTIVVFAISSSISYCQILGTPYITPVNNLTIVNFNFTGAIQEWDVPSGITKIFVDVVGAQGGDINATDRQGGAGGRVRATIVIPLGITKLYITVGGKPTINARNIPLYGFGGNGGNTQYSNAIAGAGGGLSAISIANPIAHANVLVVAGGGGGATLGANTNVGGAAGGLIGSWGGTNNWTLAGAGGSQLAGGNAGTGGDNNTTNPTPGSELSGGNGGIAINAISAGWNGGGGGGAGYYGGGGGRAGGDSQGAGGGGSSWIHPNFATVGSINIAAQNNIGHGSITIYY
jgi:hypothetical protein